MRKLVIYLYASMISMACLLIGNPSEAQTVDELKIKVQQLEAKNSALEARLKKSNKNSKNMAEQEQQMEVLREEIARLQGIIDQKASDEAAWVRSEEAKKNVKIKVADENLLNYLMRFCDMDNDGVLTQWDAEHTYVIDIARDKSLLKLKDGAPVTSLQGIEYFVNLRKLVCSGNPIPQMDLSKNVSLETLIANGCELKLIDVTNNNNLIHLEANNNLLYTIDLKANDKLQKLSLYKNKMASLDLSGCPQLKVLMCADNTLTALDLSNNVALEAIDCSDNKLTELSFNNNPKLVNITCSHNSLTHIDLQNGQDIRYLDCSKNKNLKYVVLSKGKVVKEEKKDSKTSYK